MNCLKNSRAAAGLSRLLRRRPGDVRPRPPPQQEPISRCHHTSPRRPEALQFSRGLSRHRPAVRWYQDRRMVTAAAFISGGAVITVCCGSFETVPYTNRTHFIVLSPLVERRLGEFVFQELKREMASKILPPEHPDSVRLRLMTSEIVRAAHRGLARRHRSDLYADADAPYRNASSSDLAIKNHDDTDGTDVVMLSGGSSAQPQTRHLDGLDWEVIVINDELVNAMCLPGGKILVYTGLLNHFKTDAEAATVLGHEVGHVVARHTVEKLTKYLWFVILRMVILQFIEMPGRFIDKIWELLLDLPFSRRMEIEADHIGIMLLAAAGYDPRVAPTVYDKLGKITGDSASKDYLSTHPSGKKRSQLLSQDKVMSDALKLYREANVGGQGTKGFFYFD